MKSFLDFLGSTVPDDAPVPVRRAFSQNPLSATAVVKAFLEMHPGYHTAREIHEGTGLPLPTVNSAVSNLIRYDHIQRESPLQRGRRSLTQRFQIRQEHEKDHGAIARGGRGLIVPSNDRLKV